MSRVEGVKNQQMIYIMVLINLLKVKVGSLGYVPPQKFYINVPLVPSPSKQSLVQYLVTSVNTLILYQKTSDTTKTVNIVK